MHVHCIQSYFTIFVKHVQRNSVSTFFKANSLWNVYNDTAFTYVILTIYIYFIQNVLTMINAYCFVEFKYIYVYNCAYNLFIIDYVCCTINYKSLLQISRIEFKRKSSVTDFFKSADSLFDFLFRLCILFNRTNNILSQWKQMSRRIILYLHFLNF